MLKWQGAGGFKCHVLGRDTVMYWIWEKMRDGQTRTSAQVGCNTWKSVPLYILFRHVSFKSHSCEEIKWLWFISILLSENNTIKATKCSFQAAPLPIHVCHQNFYMCAQLQKLDTCSGGSQTKGMSKGLSQHCIAVLAEDNQDNGLLHLLI